MAVKPFISFEQAQAAMKAIIDEVTKPGGMPVAVSIADDAGNMVAYAQMDNVRLYARRHAFRKAYTAAVMGMDTGRSRGAVEGAGPAESSSSLATASLWEELVSVAGWSGTRNLPLSALTP